MIATDLLKQQHREFEELIRQIETAEDDEERAALRVELADMLAAHTAVEEELFYPAALEHLGPASRIRESLEEHAVVDFALYRFAFVSVADETFSAKLATLKDVAMNHIEEEESELLPQVDGEIDRQVLEQLGDKLAVRFEERLQEGHRAILERSLGIAARQAATSAPIPKKAAPVAERQTAVKSKKGSAKRSLGAAKRGAASKRSAKTKQVAAPAPTPTTAAKKTSTRTRTNGRGESPSQRASARKTRTSTRTSQKAGRRPVRGQTTAKKSRTVG